MRLLTCILFLLCGACATTPPQEDADPIHATSQQIETGRGLAELQCGTCHAIGPSDASPVRAAPPFRYLSRRYPISSLAEALAEGIVTGHSRMPEFEMSPDEIVGLLGYIQSVQVAGAPKN